MTRPSPITRYHTNSAFASAADIYADGAAIEGMPRVLHTAGQVGIHTDGTTSPVFAEQCEQALTNLVSVLAAAGMKPENVVKLTCYVVGNRSLEPLYDARRKMLANVSPASTTVVVQGLAAPEWLIEIEAIAAA